LGENSATYISVSGELFLVVMPADITSDGMRELACDTRFWTCTLAMSALRDRSKVTSSE
jgi:hypothetical protein